MEHNAFQDEPIQTTMTAETFERHRRYLFAIAYRLLGSASEAEDIVQDAYLRLAASDRGRIDAPRSYLATVVTRLCLDHLKSARVSRAAYLGPWLPEPVPTADAVTDPALAVEQREELSFAFLVLLERLTPEERAAFVLREAFDLPYAEIAEALDKSVPAVRQLVHRARAHVADDRPRFRVSNAQQQQLVERFLTATVGGDPRALTELLTAEATLWTDGGAEARAARRPLHGSDAVARFMVGVAGKLPVDTRTTFAEINGGLGAVFWSGDSIIGVMMIESDGERIGALRIVSNPPKLAYLSRRLDATAGQSAD